MKAIIIILILFLSISSDLSLAIDYDQKVPGKNYTYRQLLLQRSFTRQLRANSKEPELNGVGVTYNTNLKIKEVEDKEGKMVKKYYLYSRNCGDIEMPEDDKEKLEKIPNGTRLKFRLKGASSCEISDWEKF